MAWWAEGADPPAVLPAAPASPQEVLRADIDRILADAGLGKTVVAVRVITLAEAATGQGGEVLYSLRADVPMIPASTMKLVTTAACLDRLGADWRIRTHVGRVPAADNRCKWDLAVLGGGDPNFSGRFWGGDPVGAFRRWAETLRQRGLKSVGRIVIDDALFDQAFQHPNWPADQRAEWYEAPVGALTVNDSCVDVYVSAGTVGGPAGIRIQPKSDYASVEGTIMTVASRAEHGFSLHRIVDSSGVRIKASGKFWVRASEACENRAVADPGMFFAETLAATLREEGIAVAGPVVRGRLAEPDGRLVAGFSVDLVHASRLDATVAVANKRSQGLYAECLLKLLGAWGQSPRAATPRPPTQGTWAGGAQEVRRWMEDRGIPADGCVIDDGSGLSKQNRLTALAVTELLAVMFERHGDSFIQTLAVAGQDGSLARRMRNTPAEGRIFGKTGYVLGASALSGYVRSAGGRLLAFSILMNEVPWGDLWKARAAQDAICQRLATY